MQHSTGNRQPPRALVVMGVSGSGKSTLAALLAERLGCPFIEGDSLHDEHCITKMRNGIALGDADRLPWLDRIAAALNDSLTHGSMAIATCSSLKKQYRERLRSRINVPTAFIFLDVGESKLRERLLARTGHYMPVALLGSQLATLENPEGEDCTLTLAADVPASELCETVVQWLHELRAAPKVRR